MTSSDHHSEVVELHVPARPEYLQLVRTVVGAAASTDPALGPDRVAALRLAVSEAATNAIEAHGTSGIEDRVVIRCNVGAGRIELEVTDRGAGFDPADVPDLPSVESAERLDHESGLGLSLMRQLADETVIEAGESGTAVRLIIKFGEGSAGT